MALVKEDYQIMISVIDNVASRGAIKGEEMLTVGELRVKVVNHLLEMEAEKKEDGAKT